MIAVLRRTCVVHETLEIQRRSMSCSAEAGEVQTAKAPAQVEPPVWGCRWPQ